MADGAAFDETAAQVLESADAYEDALAVRRHRRGGRLLRRRPGDLAVRAGGRTTRSRRRAGVAGVDGADARGGLAPRLGAPDRGWGRRASRDSRTRRSDHPANAGLGAPPRRLAHRTRPCVAPGRRDMTAPLVPHDSIGAFMGAPAMLAAGADDGALAGTSLAVKDVFDVVGTVTGAGNPDFAAGRGAASSNAVAVQQLVDAGASVVGKTITDELAYSLAGTNVHYGTPTNVNAPGHAPGGSSAGSAAAVAAGLVDLAIGTDTGGSIRVPASYCGIYGWRPTHGAVSVDGVVPLAPGYDTVGLFARDPRCSLARPPSCCLRRPSPRHPFGSSFRQSHSARSPPTSSSSSSSSPIGWEQRPSPCRSASTSERQSTPSGPCRAPRRGRPTATGSRRPTPTSAPASPPGSPPRRGSPLSRSPERSRSDRTSPTRCVRPPPTERCF